MYTVIGGPKNRAFRVHWALHEMGIDYETRAHAPRSEEVLALNPSGKVPVLLVDGEPITDSVAILSFLADRHGQLTAPPGTLERGRQDAMTQFAVEELDGLLWFAARHSFVLPEEWRVPAVKPSLKWEFARSIERLARRMDGREFAAGDSFSIADIVVAHCLGWAIVAKFPNDDPQVRAYFDRMRARPAYLAAREVAA